MSAFRKVLAFALGHNIDMEKTAAELQNASVPISDSPCRGCADPCDEGHDEYPKLDIDRETELLGTVKLYGRQVIISTGKTDWPKEVTDVKGTLASYLDSVAGPLFGSGGEKDKDKDSKAEEKKSEEKATTNGSSLQGVWDADPAKTKRISIQNSSLRTVCDDDNKETVLVFPDFKVVTGVEQSKEGAEALWQHAVSPSVRLFSPPPEGNNGSAIKTWILPYSCVILLCSHKRRDNRCAIAAPKLEHALTSSLEREGWEVHHQVEDPSMHGPALEDDPALQATSSEEEKQAEIRRRLQRVGEDPNESGHKRALILFCSHVGGHKYAGNVIINTPLGVCIWYGRVTPHEVDAIVRETIIGGKILPPLLRGGIGLCRPGHKSLNDW